MPLGKGDFEIMHIFFAMTHLIWFEIHPHEEKSTDVLIDMFEINAHELSGKRK